MVNLRRSRLPSLLGRALLAAMCLTLVSVTSRSNAAFSGATEDGASSVAAVTVAAPSGLIAQGGVGEVRLDWTATTSTWADGYYVMRSTTSGCCYSTVGSVSGVATTSYTDTATSGVDYYYTIVARHLSWSSAATPEEAAQPTASLIARYEFDETSGSTVADTSGFGTALDLTIADPSNVTWGVDQLTIDIATTISNPDSSKLVTAIKASNELTFEAWVTPANLTQAGPSRIVSISLDLLNRDATMSQEADAWNLRVRTSISDSNGRPDLESAAGTVDSIRLFHLVSTRDAAGWIRIYVDGVEVASRSDGGDLSPWVIPGYEVLLANEATGDRPWLGTYDRVAIYDRALTSTEIVDHFTGGP